MLCITKYCISDITYVGIQSAVLMLIKYYINNIRENTCASTTYIYLFNFKWQLTLKISQLILKNLDLRETRDKYIFVIVLEFDIRASYDDNKLGFQIERRSRRIGPIIAKNFYFASDIAYLPKKFRRLKNCCKKINV